MHAQTKEPAVTECIGCKHSPCLLMMQARGSALQFLEPAEHHQRRHAWRSRQPCAACTACPGHLSTTVRHRYVHLGCVGTISTCKATSIGSVHVIMRHAMASEALPATAGAWWPWCSIECSQRRPHDYMSTVTLHPYLMHCMLPHGVTITDTLHDDNTSTLQQSQWAGDAVEAGCAAALQSRGRARLRTCDARPQARTPGP
jgi:hypothetical protein